MLYTLYNMELAKYKFKLAFCTQLAPFLAPMYYECKIHNILCVELLRAILKM